MTLDTSPFDELVDIVGELVVGLNQAYGPIPSLARLANRLDALRHPVPPKAYTAVNDPATARHICRQCGVVIEPGPTAHARMADHALIHHKLKLPSCSSQCGYRATPSEGRYTPANPWEIPAEQSRFKTTTPTLDDLITTLAPGQRWRDPAYGDFTIRDTMGRSVGLTWDYPNGQLTTVDATAFYPEHGLIRLADAPAVQPRYIVTDRGTSRHPWLVWDQSNRITGEPLEVCACIHEGTARRIADALNAQEGATHG